ncbi:hypothetical protein BH11PSE11_BH11PSE11_15710 [soil metagenome]
MLALASLALSVSSAHAFVDNGNGTVTDTGTGLTWMRCAIGQTWNGSTCTGLAVTLQWGQAVALNPQYAGRTDWRLAGIEELRTLVDTTQSGLKINPIAFPNTPSVVSAGGTHSGFWSRTPSVIDAKLAWGVNFGDGSSDTVSKDSTLGFARMVRDGPTTGPYALLVAKFGTGAGAVTSNPAGILCGDSCSKTLASGTSLTLNAIPAQGSYFAGWGGACVGRTPCSVTMDAGRAVKAVFNKIPFEAGVTSTITPTTATVRANIAFNAADQGKQGAIFITATVKARALLTSLRDANPYKSANPDRAAADEAPLTTDPNSTVLVQLTQSGWQQVVDGQLVPYASGVLGETLASQTILNNTNTSDLQGAEFCMGYGTSAPEMVAGGRMVSVASIPDPAASAAATTGTCAVSGAVSTAASPLTGLWWNPAESGWGISLTQQSATVFAAWFTYNQAGQPNWYVMPSCPLTSNTCSGDIYRVTGATALTVPWNGAGKLVTKVGAGTMFFTDNDNANFSYSVDGSSASRPIMRQVFAAGSADPVVDYSALWWNPAESGWGVALAQQYAMIFATMYTYDATGNPIWYVASSCPVVSNACSGDLYKVIGGTPPSIPWNGNGKVVSKVGTTQFNFTDGSNGTMTYTINGVSGSRAITRQLF